jgi:mannitol-1-/sugar-/sorbitol-6-phosphatase
MDSMPKVCCKALLFDMDGVLVDSTPAVARVWRRWACEHGLDPERVAEMAHGRPSIATVRELLPDADHEAENRILERREIEDLEGVVACKGAFKLLEALPEDRWVVVTSSTRPLAEVRLRAAGLPAPRHLITSSDVENGKPHPEPFLKAAEALGFEPRDCLVVEDSPAGIRAGKQAGCRVIAFRTTMPDEALRSAGPDWVVDGCQALELVATRPGEVCLRL